MIHRDNPYRPLVRAMVYGATSGTVTVVTIAVTESSIHYGPAIPGLLGIASVLAGYAYGLFTS